MYKVIDLNEFSKRKQYLWFRTFSNPCYGFDVEMDVTSVVEYSKETKTSFFINILYLVTIGLNSIDEMRIREVNNEIRLYDNINPTFTVMCKNGIYENSGINMINNYQEFYQKAHETIENVKKQTKVKEDFNSNDMYNDYYITCIPWLSIKSMTHPIPNNNYESMSCPRVCWDKYTYNNGKYKMTLNITVNHCFVDGKPLSDAFINIQNNFNNIYKIVKSK